MYFKKTACQQRPFNDSPGWSLRIYYILRVINLSGNKLDTKNIAFVYNFASKITLSYVFFNKILDKQVGLKSETQFVWIQMIETEIMWS